MRASTLSSLQHLPVARRAGETSDALFGQGRLALASVEKGTAVVEAEV